MGSSHDQSNLLCGSIQVWKSLLFLWGREFLLTSSPDMARCPVNWMMTRSPCSYLSMKRRCSVQLLHPVQRSWADVGKVEAANAPRSPGLWSQAGSLRDLCLWGVLNLLEEVTEQQEAAGNFPANSIQRPAILGTFILFALCGEKLSLGAGRWHGKEIRCFLKKKKNDFPVQIPLSHRDFPESHQAKNQAELSWTHIYYSDLELGGNRRIGDLVHNLFPSTRGLTFLLSQARNWFRWSPRSLLKETVLHLVWPPVLWLICH